MEANNSQESLIDSREAIKDRFKTLLLNEKIHEDVLQDFMKTFSSIGMSKEEAKTFSLKVMDIIKEGSTLSETEDRMQELFKETKVGETPFFEKLSNAMRNREKIIVSQVSPYLQDVKGKVIDYGAGSGKVAQE